MGKPSNACLLGRVFHTSCGSQRLGLARGGQQTADATLLTVPLLGIYLIQRARLAALPHVA